MSSNQLWVFSLILAILITSWAWTITIVRFWAYWIYDTYPEKLYGDILRGRVYVTDPKAWPLVGIAGSVYIVIYVLGN